jgi:uncharacterized protein (DUF1800 family)
MSTSDQVATHVAAARNLAACLEAVGVGTHPQRGHAAVLRRMANHIETSAARNEKPSEFNDAGLYAARDRLSAAIGADPAVGPLLERLELRAAASAGESVDTATIDARLAKAGITGRHAIEAKIKLQNVGVLGR